MWNTNQLFKVILAVMLPLFWGSCSKDKNEDVAPIDYSYFPMKVGDSLVYVLHVYDKDLNEIDSSYQMLERVESLFDDNEGRPTFRLERYVRTDENHAWSIFKVWTANVTTTLAEKKEDNITYIKLVFPVAKSIAWDGNSKNINAGNSLLDDYKITELNVPLDLNTLHFDSSLTVTQLNDDNFIESRYAIEQYAKGKGMVYKEQTDSLQNNSGYKMKIHKYTETLIYSNN